MATDRRAGLERAADRLLRAQVAYQAARARAVPRPGQADAERELLARTARDLDAAETSAALAWASVKLCNTNATAP